MLGRPLRLGLLPAVVTELRAELQRPRMISGEGLRAADPLLVKEDGLVEVLLAEGFVSFGLDRLDVLERDCAGQWGVLHFELFLNCYNKLVRRSSPGS